MQNEEVISAAIQRIAETARTFGAQAGVGGMETAGGIVSFLAANPEWIGAFFKNGSVFDLPPDWLARGDLTWHAQNGRVLHPSEARQARANNLARLENGRWHDPAAIDAAPAA